MNVERVVQSVPGLSRNGRADLRRNAERWRDTGSDAQREAATLVLAALERQESAEQSAWIDRLGDDAKAARIVAAFTTTPPTETDLTVIRALAENPGSSSADLSRACGWNGQIWHTHFGKMCGARRADLWPGEYVPERDAEFLSGILADFHDLNRFTLKPEARKAFAALGYIAET
jgi:hypothetical protein